MLDIIIPVYNTPTHDIERCLKNLNKIKKLNKIIIIDDGSKQETAEFLDKYVKNNKLYLLKHVENGGVSKARNIGLNFAKSEYVMFIDSDDSIEAEAVNKACKYMTEHKLDVIIGGSNIVYNDKIISKKTSFNKIKIYESEELLKVKDRIYSGKYKKSNFELKNIYLARIHAKIFNRNKFNKIRFDETLPLSEDSLFSIDLAMESKRIGVIDDIMYNYYQNEYSVLHRKNNYKDIVNLVSFSNALFERAKLVEDKNLYDSLIMRILGVRMTNVKKILKIKQKKLFLEFLDEYYTPIEYKMFKINQYNLTIIERLFTLFFKLPYKIQKIILKITYLFINNGGKDE